ncbi:MAG: hypothetical protein EOM37_05820 [Proteobacteria bacterium]|nr:hypothetical protein [Pseudomonadota bacterium]
MLRLGIDLGTTSLGWALLEIRKEKPASLIGIGVRIFSDGRDAQSSEPLAVARRNARGMRRNKDRRLLRRKKLLTLLVENALMPKEEGERRLLEKKDPYQLRERAIKEKIELYELGRALFHINQRRGFKSNLKTDRRENDLGALKGAIRDLETKLDETNSRTLGSFLAKTTRE